MASDDLIYIEPLNNEHRMDIGVTLGISAALNVLNKADEVLSRLPGFNTARNLIEALHAEQRAYMAGHNLRAAQAAGYDISTHMVGVVGRGRIFVKPMDLEELALFAAEQKDRG